MSSRRTPELEKVSPLPDIIGYCNFGFQRVGKQGTGFLGAGTQLKQLQVVFFRQEAAFLPKFISPAPFFIKKRFYHCYFVAKFVPAIITVPGGFLTVTADPMPHQFVRYTPVNNK
jgi:hypothetical protein